MRRQPARHGRTEHESERHRYFDQKSLPFVVDVFRLGYMCSMFRCDLIPEGRERFLPFFDLVGPIDIHSHSTPTGH